MPARVIDDPVFDLMSYARRGPGRRARLTPAQLQQIARTVGRAPEVMVKVLPRGASDLGAVRRHLNYIGRKGGLDLEADDGQTLRDAHAGRDMIEDWDLELNAHRPRNDLDSRPGRQTPRLIHKLVFSMPAGTPPERVLKAVRNFCREEFGLKHRYVMALHTDEPHPHVHVVVKAVSEEGQRLNIRKTKLREWRSEFARHLRELGVPANATQRYMRGETKPRKSDPIYRANLRGDSTDMRQRAKSVARHVSVGRRRIEPRKAKVIATHQNIQQAWRAVSAMLLREGQRELADQVWKFADQMPAQVTEREWFAQAPPAHARAPLTRERPGR